MNHRFQALRTFQLPSSIFKDKSLVLSATAVAVLMTLLTSKRRRERDIFATSKISKARIGERTSLSNRAITHAVNELQDNRLVLRIGDQRRKRGDFGVNEYLLCDPRSGEPIQNDGNRYPYFSVRVSYFAVPRDFVLRSEQRWSLANVTLSELSVYSAALWRANRHTRNHDIPLKPGELRHTARLSPDTYRNAKKGVQDKGLVWFAEDSLSLCDPYTGLPFQEVADPEDDPENYFREDEKGHKRRANFNVSPAELKELLLSCLRPESRVVDQGNGDILIQCPYHGADVHPSCSVSPTKRCFHCFTCAALGLSTASGFIGKLIQKLTSGQAGQVEYIEPHELTDAIYHYKDEEGKLMKQVLRFPDKRFTQRKSRSVRNIRGVRPTLYNLQHFAVTGTLCVTEGEKDANTVTNLKLKDFVGYEIIGTTSGSADSWKDCLADQILGKRVIVMGDNDEPGRAYVARVIDSLKRRDIEHRLVQVPFGKDISDFLELGGTASELVRLIGSDWIIDPAPDAALFEECQPVTA